MNLANRGGGENAEFNGSGKCHENEEAFNIPKSTFNIVSWVPLWGTGDRNADRGTRKTKQDGDGETDPAFVNDTLEAAELRAKRGWHSSDLVVMYSGNMGLGHRFGEILAAARHLSGCAGRDQDGRPRMGTGGISTQAAGTRTRMVFFGGGKRRSEVVEFVDDHPDCGLEIHDYAPADQLTAHLMSADVHLVSLNPEWTGTMVPSKLQGIFAVGRPAIFIGSKQSCIATWLLESGGGWVVNPGDVGELLDVLEEARNPQVRMVRGRAAKAYADTHFSKDCNASRVAGLFESIVL